VKSILEVCHDYEARIQRIKIYTCVSKLNQISLRKVIKEYMILHLTFIHPSTIKKLKEQTFTNIKLKGPMNAFSLYNNTFDLYSSIYYREAKNNVIKI
jgi:hypothetical protein